MSGARRLHTSTQFALLLLVRDGRITSPELASKLGISAPAARHTFTRLRRAGLATYQGAEDIYRCAPRSVLVPTEKAGAALLLPLDTPVRSIARVMRPKKPAVTTKCGSGVIAGRKEIRGYVYPGARW